VSTILNPNTLRLCASAGEEILNGSLDEEKLDKVMSELEKLHDRNRMVGVISHVREMNEWLPRYLEVVAAGEDGSRIRE
jgi:DNA repair protein SbcC/Rad50